MTTDLICHRSNYAFTHQKAKVDGIAPLFEGVERCGGSLRASPTGLSCAPSKEQRRDMTLIVGFPVPGAVILGADGEEGTSIHKAAVRKIAPISGPGYTCAVGGAGDANFIDLAVQEASESIRQLSPPTLADIRRCIEKVVTEIYAERIDQLPPNKARNAEFELLCAIWAEQDKKAQLIKVGRGYSLIRQGPDLSGTGTYLASYLIETLAESPNRRQAERLAAYVLAQAKAHVQSVGGASQIIVVTDEGRAELVPKGVIEEDEFAGQSVMGAVRLLFNWMDLIGTRGDIGQLNKVADDVITIIKDAFKIRHENLLAFVKKSQTATAQAPPPDRATAKADEQASTLVQLKKKAKKRPGRQDVSSPEKRAALPVALFPGTVMTSPSSKVDTSDGEG